MRYLFKETRTYAIEADTEAEAWERWEEDGPEVNCLDSVEDTGDGDVEVTTA